MIVRFDVHHRPVSVNEMYLNRRGGRGKGRILTNDAREYKAAVSSIAFVVARSVGWPKPEFVSRCGVSIVVWNTRHDTGACDKATVDALEGIFFKNDRVVRPLNSDRDSDGGLPRVEIRVSIPDV